MLNDLYILHPGIYSGVNNVKTVHSVFILKLAEFNPPHHANLNNSIALYVFDNDKDVRFTAGLLIEGRTTKYDSCELQIRARC